MRSLLLNIIFYEECHGFDYHFRCFLSNLGKFTLMRIVCSLVYLSLCLSVSLCQFVCFCPASVLFHWLTNVKKQNRTKQKKNRQSEVSVCNTIGKMGELNAPLKTFVALHLIPVIFMYPSLSQNRRRFVSVLVFHHLLFAAHRVVTTLAPRILKGCT